MRKCFVTLAAAALWGVAATSIAAPDGKQVYGGTCIACHGPNGRGALPGIPDLTGKAGRLAKSESELLQRVRDGFQSPGSPMAMPPKGGDASLTDDDLKAVIRYMKENFGR